MGISGFIKGEALIRLRSAFPERTMNLLTQRGIALRSPRREGKGEVIVAVSRREAEEVFRLAGESGLFTAERVKAAGLPYAVNSLRLRAALALGLIICAVLVTLSGFYIWEVEVVGAVNVPAEVILLKLRELGVTQGTLTFSVDRDRVSNELCLSLPELSWATVNVRGSRASVIVREARSAPELVYAGEPGELTARRTGTVTAVAVIQGRALVAVGDSVLEGETLVVSEKAAPIASVTARTEYELSASMPTEYCIKTFTGRRETRVTLVLGEKRIKLYNNGGNPYEICDTISEERRLTLPGGQTIPVAVSTETLCECRLERVTIETQEAVRLLSARLAERLGRLCPCGSVVSEEWETCESEGLVTVTLRAVCSEEIT